VGVEGSEPISRARFALRLTHASFQGGKPIPFGAVFVCVATDEAKQAIEKINADAAVAYNAVTSGLTDAV
jgi:hypothetical protein